MYKYILETAGNINWMALFALLTFVTIFTLSAYLVFKKDKEELNRLSSLPLADDDPIIIKSN
jgi:hypothetical protein